MARSRSMLDYLGTGQVSAALIRLCHCSHDGRTLLTMGLLQHVHAAEQSAAVNHVVRRRRSYRTGCMLADLAFCDRSADTSVQLQTEWNHFVKLNHTIPADTPPKIADELDYPGRDDPLTTPVKEGLLERQKRFLKTWSSGALLQTTSVVTHLTVHGSHLSCTTCIQASTY